LLLDKRGDSILLELSSGVGNQHSVESFELVSVNFTLVHVVKVLPAFLKVSINFEVGPERVEISLIVSILILGINIHFGEHNFVTVFKGIGLGDSELSFGILFGVFLNDFTHVLITTLGDIEVGWEFTVKTFRDLDGFGRGDHCGKSN
tara:strand:+ start:74 stop:517 length:444 start_codon:yes stop_codon:yes gene_type:complete